MNSSLNNAETEKTCPYLGIPSDPQTAFDYPSSQNYCYHVSPPAAPGVSHQQQFCLGALHTQCKRYAQKSSKPIPVEFLLDVSPKKFKSKLFLRLGFLGFLAVVIVGVAIWLIQIQNHAETPFIQPHDQATPIAQMALASNTMTDTPQPAPTMTPVPTHTPAPSLTPTATQIPPHMLETSFGASRLFLLHRVMSGESLIRLGETYNTSIEAIRAVNFGLEGILLSNSVIIIPVDQVDVTGVPPMTGYEIVLDGISVESLANEHNIDLSQLLQLNNLPQNYIFHSGEWVLLPHAPLVP